MQGAIVPSAPMALAMIVCLVVGSGCTAHTDEANTGAAALALQERLAAAERAVERREDYKAIQRLQRAYGYYLDEGMAERIGELFAAGREASVEIGGSGVYLGRNRITEYFLDSAGALGDRELRQHMILQGVVHVADDGNTAHGRWRALILAGEHGESAHWAEGPYENEYVKEDGVWRFSRVRWYATVIAPYEPGWHREPLPLPGPSEDNPPDLPPSDLYQTFPGAYLPPYHYGHPVTGMRDAGAGAQPAGAGEPDSTLEAGAADAAQSPDGEPDPAPAIDDTWDRLQRLAARVRQIEDINALENLQRSYGYYLDKMLWEHVADLFAADGTLEVGTSGAFAGRDEIVAYLRRLSAGRDGPLPGVLYNHFQLQPIVHVAPDGRSATARWRAFLQLGTHGAGSGGSWGAGIYENEYVREDGRWKIARLHFHPTFIAPYEGGWAHASAALLHAYVHGDAAGPDTVAPFAPAPPFDYDPAAPSLPTADAIDPVGVGPRDAAAMANAVAELQAAAERLADRDALENLSGIYGYYVDKSMHDQVTDLFTEDAWLEILGRGVFLGRDRIREYMHNLGPAGPRENALFNHMHLQPVIHVSPDGTTAHIRARLFVMFGLLDNNAQLGEGIYENEFVKEDGVWKFSRLHGFQTFYTLYEDGWARRSSPIFAPYPQLPPDLPQSVPYDPYPEAFVPPFHYPNPVSGRTP